MRLLGGINRDDNPHNQKEGTWRDARNILVDTASSLTLDEDIIEYFEFNEFASICGVIPLDKDFIVFTTFDADPPTVSAIYKVTKDNDGVIVSQLVVATRDWNFTVNSPIQGEYKYNYKGEVEIIWYADNDYPRTVNVDDPKLDVDDYSILLPTSLIHTLLHPIPLMPVVQLDNVYSTGGRLPSGIYYVTIQYQNKDLSYNLFHPVTNAIPVYRFSPKDDWWNQFANEAGKSTSKYISINVSNVDTRFEKFRIGIIHRSDGVLTGYLGEEFSTSTTNKIGIHTLEGLTVIDPAEITVNTLHFKRIGTTTNVQNTVYAGDIEMEPRVLYQQHAANIKVEYTYDDAVAFDQYEDSYNSSVVLFDKKGLMPDEIYALYIRFYKTQDGRPTEAFHIPGREVEDMVDDFPENVKETAGKPLDVYNGARRFHFRNTADVNGKVGFWENETEVYPMDEQFDGTNGGTIVGGVDLRGQNVRHHKMPSFYTLQDWYEGPETNEPPISYDTASAAIDWAFLMKNPGDGRDYPTFNTLNSNFGAFQDGKQIDNTSDQAISGSIGWQVVILAIYPSALSRIKISRMENNVEIENIHEEAREGYFDDTGSIDAITLQPGQGLKIELSAEGYPATYGGRFHGNFNRSTESTFTGKILGLKLSNIEIPQEIVDTCSHYEILYAKREIQDMSVIGQGIMLPTRETDSTKLDNARFYSFDPLNKKLALGASHMKYMYTCESNFIDKPTAVPTSDNIYHEKNEQQTGITIDELYVVTKAKYIQQDASHAEPSNLEGEENIAVYFPDKYDPLDFPKDMSMPKLKPRAVYQGTQHLGFTAMAICAFKPDMYKSFDSQSLVRTGKLFPITEATTEETGKLFGFDTVFAPYGTITMSGADEKNAFIANYISVVYSLGHVGYRWGDNPTEYFMPKHDLVGTGAEGSNGSESGPTSDGDSSLATKIKAAAGVEFISQVPEFYGYSDDLHAVNDIGGTIIYVDDNNFIDEMTNRIFRSDPQQTETLVNNWRVFRVNQYYDSVYNKGRLYNLDNNGRDLIIQHASAMFVTRHLSELRINEGVVAALGTADIFDTQPKEIVPTNEGYVGCQSKFASVRSKVGNLVVDREQGKIFLYVDGKVDEISKKGLEKWFRKNLQISIESHTQDYLDVDNPYINRGIVGAYDDKYNRFIISKIDIDPSSPANNSWTMSYYPAIGAWVSFHDVEPNMLFTTRLGVFSIQNIGTGVTNPVINKFNGGHNVAKTGHIDVVFNEPIGINKQYLSVIWDTIVKDGNNIVFKNKTFTGLVIYNYNRHSDKISLTPYVFPDGNVRITGGSWKFNEFRDLLEEKDTEVMDRFDIHELQFEDIPLAMKQDNWKQQGRFDDNFIVVRFIFEAEAGETIQINSVNVNKKDLLR